MRSTLTILRWFFVLTATDDDVSERDAAPAERITMKLGWFEVRCGVNERRFLRDEWSSESSQACVLQPMVPSAFESGGPRLTCCPHRILLVLSQHVGPEGSRSDVLLSSFASPGACLNLLLHFRPYPRSRLSHCAYKRLSAAEPFPTIRHSSSFVHITFPTSLP